MKNKLFSIRTKTLELNQLRGFVKDAIGMYGQFGCTVAELGKLIGDTLLTKPSYLDSLEIKISDAENPNDIYKIVIGSAFGLDEFTDMTVCRVDGLQKKMSVNDLNMLVNDLLTNPDYKMPENPFSEQLRKNIRSCEKQWGRRATVQQFLNQNTGTMFISSGHLSINDSYYRINVRYKHGMGYIEVSTAEGFKRKVTFNTLASMFYKQEAKSQ